MTRWPGFSARGTLLLPLQRADWLADDGPRLLDGERFDPKREVHVTLLGTAAGSAVRDALAAGRGTEGDLASAFEAHDWTPRPMGMLLRLRKARAAEDDASASMAESIVQPVALPAMAAFRGVVTAITGVALPFAPPHVTLYVRGDPDGIGVPDEATLAALRVGELDHAALSPG